MLPDALQRQVERGRVPQADLLHFLFFWRRPRGGAELEVGVDVLVLLLLDLLHLVNTMAVNVMVMSRTCSRTMRTVTTVTMMLKLMVPIVPALVLHMQPLFISSDLLNELRIPQNACRECLEVHAVALPDALTTGSATSHPLTLSVAAHYCTRTSKSKTARHPAASDALPLPALALALLLVLPARDMPTIILLTPQAAALAGSDSPKSPSLLSFSSGAKPASNATSQLGWLL